jgi:lactate dehydrogenase-like 2-hydroxyacid dehydrogenase
MMPDAQNPRPVLLVLGHLPAPYDARLRERFTCHEAIVAADVALILADHAQEIEAIALINELGVDGKLIAALPALRMIANFGAGYDDIDLSAAAARGLVVTNTPDVTTEEVADVAMALLVMAVRNLGAAERFLRDGKWSETNAFPLSIGTLRGRRMGIYGFGRIGQAVARRAPAFGLEVSYHSRRPVEGNAARYFPSLREMASHIDTLMICAAGGAGTRHSINGEILNLLGPEGILVNISRGSVVDTADLIEALRSRRILGAALDVFENEPHVPPELLELNNAVLMPHLGSGSQHTHRMMAKLTFDNLVAWFETGRPLTPIVESAAWAPVTGQSAR